MSEKCQYATFKMKGPPTEAASLFGETGYLRGFQVMIAAGKPGASDGLELYQNRYVGWPGDAYAWRFTE
jgi:hypothetical protein